MEALWDGGENVLRDDLRPVGYALEWVAVGVELLAIAVMLLGTGRFLMGFLSSERVAEAAVRAGQLDSLRVQLGRYILAALQLIIIADIIHITLSYALADLIYLGALVLIRFAISFFLGWEIRELQRNREP